MLKANLLKQKKFIKKKCFNIFQQCQQEEEQRLEQIKETLYDLSQAIQLKDQQQSALTAAYQDLTNNIQTKQDSFADTVFWAQTYGAIDDQTKSVSVSEDLEASIKSTMKIKRPTTLEESEAQAIATTTTVDNAEGDEEITTKPKTTTKKSNNKASSNQSGIPKKIIPTDTTSTANVLSPV